MELQVEQGWKRQQPATMAIEYREQKGILSWLSSLQLKMLWFFKGSLKSWVDGKENIKERNVYIGWVGGNVWEACGFLKGVGDNQYSWRKGTAWGPFRHGTVGRWLVDIWENVGAEILWKFQRTGSATPPKCSRLWIWDLFGGSF